MRAQKTIGQGLVFAEQSEQQVFGLNIGRPELAGFVPRKKDYAPGFLRVAFEHIPIPPRVRAERPALRQTPDPTTLIMHLYRLISQAISPCSNLHRSYFGNSEFFNFIFYFTSLIHFFYSLSLIVVLFRISLRRKRLRRHFFHFALIQP